MALHRLDLPRGACHLVLSLTPATAGASRILSAAVLNGEDEQCAHASGPLDLVRVDESSTPCVLWVDGAAFRLHSREEAAKVHGLLHSGTNPA